MTPLDNSTNSTNDQETNSIVLPEKQHHGALHTQCRPKPRPNPDERDTDTKTLDPAFLVKFENGDPEDPRNFSSKRKAFLTFQMSMLALVGALGSSILSPGQSAIAEYTHISQEVAVLATSLYVLGSSISTPILIDSC